MTLLKAIALGAGTGLLAAALVGCGGGERKVELNPQELTVTARAGVPVALVLQLKAAGAKLRQLEGGEDVPLPGVTADVSRHATDDLLRQLRDAAPPGYVIFVSGVESRWTDLIDHVSIMRAESPFEVLAAMGTNGANYNLSTEQVIERLKAWDARYGLVFREIGTDTVAAEFKRRPPNMLEFAREVYAFCPDTVDQGVGSVAKLASQMERTNSVSLWWD